MGCIEKAFADISALDPACERHVHLIANIVLILMILLFASSVFNYFRHRHSVPTNVVRPRNDLSNHIVNPIVTHEISFVNQTSIPQSTHPSETFYTTEIIPLQEPLTSKIPLPPAIIPPQEMHQSDIIPLQETSTSFEEMHQSVISQTDVIPSSSTIQTSDAPSSSDAPSMTDAPSSYVPTTTVASSMPDVTSTTEEMEISKIEESHKRKESEGDDESSKSVPPRKRKTSNSHIDVDVSNIIFSQRTRRQRKPFGKK